MRYLFPAVFQWRLPWKRVPPCNEGNRRLPSYMDSDDHPSGLWTDTLPYIPAYNRRGFLRGRQAFHAHLQPLQMYMVTIIILRLATIFCNLVTDTKNRSFCKQQGKTGSWLIAYTLLRCNKKIVSFTTTRYLCKTVTRWFESNRHLSCNAFCCK